MSFSLSFGILGQLWYLIVSIPDLRTLTYFVYNKWINDIPAKLAGGRTLSLSGGFENHQRVVEIAINIAHDVNSQFSTQKEADTRLLLHVNGSRTRYGTRIAIV